MHFVWRSNENNEAADESAVKVSKDHEPKDSFYPTAIRKH